MTRPDTRAFVVYESDRPVERSESAEHGEVSWRTLVSADRSPSRALTVGIAEVEPGRTTRPRPHRHAEAEVYHVLSGEGEVTIDGVRHPVRAGATVYIPGYASHVATNTGPGLLRILYVFPTDSFSDVLYEYL